MSTQPTSKDLLAAIRAKAIVGSKKWECCDVRGSLHEIVDMIDAATSSSVEPRNDDDGRARPTQQDESGRLSQDQRAPDQLNAATGQKSGSSSPTPPPEAGRGHDMESFIAGARWARMALAGGNHLNDEMLKEDAAHFADTGGNIRCRAMGSNQPTSEQVGTSLPPGADALDAARWRFAKDAMCYSFDGERRTYYLNGIGRDDFQSVIDARIALTKGVE